jgi:hypothetical protein
VNIMSAFGNSSGSGTTQSMASALGSNAPAATGTVDPSAGVAGLGNALNAGSGAMGNPNANTYAFQLPSGTIAQIAANQSSANNSGGTSTAGLTGVGSGTQAATTMPDFANATTGSGNYSSNGINMGGLAAAGGKLTDALKNQQDQTVKSGGTGRVMMRPSTFGAPVVALPMASGSPQGNSLLSMLQKYRAGTV